LKSVLVATGFPEAVVTRYRHWDIEVEASVAFEAAQLANQSPPLVIAKSLGTVIAATAFCLHQFRPAAAVLIGTPYAALEIGDLRFLHSFPLPWRHCSSSSLKTLEGRLQDWRLHFNLCAARWSRFRGTTTCTRIRRRWPQSSSVGANKRVERSYVGIPPK
jgi:alpha-beta hydrolase superfamily lysophospholipase